LPAPAASPRSASDNREDPEHDPNDSDERGRDGAAPTDPAELAAAIIKQVHART
jgi:hypothetical protein